MTVEMATLKETFGERVRDRRKELGWNQADLAKLLDTTQSTISDIEKGQHAPNLDTVARIAKILKVDPQDLLS
jgi:y4mF family transcriptional regulator